MPATRILSEEEVFRLPPMLFGAIRWSRSLGAPSGELASGFTFVVQEHTATQFEDTGGGIQPVPGTGVWRPPVTAASWTAPDEGDMHVVRFNYPDAHLNAFPDGKYRVSVQLAGYWPARLIERIAGFRVIEPLAWYITLTKAQHIFSADFQMIQQPWWSVLPG
ncbi:MAG: hypothetical protein JWO83_2157 [Caulobacteraceae bacterium]|nr:hypothetical protein [Caulobacteraceae bacterium]